MTTRQESSKKQRSKRGRWIVGVSVLALAAAGWILFRGGDSVEDAVTFVARRGPLRIGVLEGGSIEALSSQEIRSEVKGYQGTKILSIVEEGYLVSDEDVKAGKILVELDSSELKQRIVTQDIQFQSTSASLTEARQSYEIQLNQNKSDIKAAEQKVRFALLDLEKFLGDEVAQEIVADLGLDSDSSGTVGTNAPPETLGDARAPGGPLLLASADTLEPPGMLTDAPGERVAAARLAAVEAKGAPVDLEASVTREIGEPLVDFSDYAVAEKLGDGEAKQKLRKLEDDLLLAQTEQNLARTKLEGTRRLHEKQFVTENELQNETINYDKSTLKVQTAETALAMFQKYEFTKSAEEFLSKYEEALRGLERARKEAVSKLAQAEAKARAAESRYRIEEKQIQELQEQVEKCVIRAEKPGLVVYGGGDDRRYYGNEEQIREGATVRERQPIITIPNMNEMGVTVKIHESHIKKVKKGMTAAVVVDAFPDERLQAEVTKVAVLPDSQNRWMNPDLKVYVTQLKIKEVREWLKPGMSAKVDIVVNELEDAVYIPLQAVQPDNGKHYCFVMQSGRVEKRPIETGEFNDEFIEVRSGLAEGEEVLLRKPEAPEGEAKPADATPEEEAAAAA